jgi:hypothetical protein
MRSGDLPDKGTCRMIRSAIPDDHKKRRYDQIILPRADRELRLQNLPVSGSNP